MHEMIVQDRWKEKLSRRRQVHARAETQESLMERSEVAAAQVESIVSSDDFGTVFVAEHAELSVPKLRWEKDTVSVRSKVGALRTEPPQPLTADLPR